MLPKFLYGSYKRYKADTTTFVDWLIETAKKCGNPATLEKNPDGRQKSKKSTEAPKYKLNLEELSRLAQTVAQSSVKVPPVVLAAVKRAISLRKRCASWFSASHKRADRANETHSHFIEVLERLCEVLEWKSPKPAAASAGASKSQTTAGEHQELEALANNSFAALSLEGAKNAEQPSIDQPASPEEGLVEIDEGEADDDNPYSLLFLHLFCMFEDLQNLRQFVLQTLTEYVEGQIDLMNMAVVADTAVHLAKQLIYEVTSAWAHIPELRDEQSIQQFIYMTACTFRGKHWGAKPDPAIPFNINMADVADWCYLPTFILLTSFKDVLQPNQLPVFKKGHFGVYNPGARRDHMSPGQRFNEDKILLLELLPEFTLLQQFKIDPPVTDEITAGLISFVKHRKTPLWLSFATQILLDVHHGLRHTNQKAFNDLRLSALRTKKTIDEYWSLSKTFSSKPTFWPKEGDEAIEGVHSAVQAWVTNDAVGEFKENALPQNPKNKVQAAGGIEKHFLLKSHGVLCGLMAFDFTLNMQQIGLSLINQWYDVVQMAYLYNLAQQTGVSKLQWPDMDVFIELHGAEHMFIGGRPKTADESIKKLRLATGISSPSDFARGSRNASGRGSTTANNNVRLMEPSTAVKTIFQDRYVKHGQNKLSVDNVDKLIKEISPSDKLQPAPEAQLTATAGLQTMHHRWDHTHRLGALQLLAAIKQGLYAEEPRLQFNYFAMHKRCIDMLRLIQAKEDHKFRQYFGPGYMPDDTFISNLVLLVLTVAQRSRVESQQMGIGAPEGGAMTSRIVVSCAEVMREYLRDNGDKVCKELKTFCKNQSLGEARGVEIESKKYAYWFNVGEVIDPASLASFQTGIRLA